MGTELEARKDVCLLRLPDRVQPAAYVRARAELEAAGCRKVVVDCQGAPYLDAAGIGFIADLYKSLMNSGGELALANVTPLMREELEVTLLDGLIPIFDDEQAALAALNYQERAAYAV